MTVIKKEADVTDISVAEIQAALKEILTSKLFIKAVRRSCLLRFLVEKAISGPVQDTSEYIIGVKVFDRDPSTYNTNEDPIVRVQIGRLREKLKIYYSTLEVGSNIEISIPMGSYMPIIRRMNTTGAKLNQRYMLAIHPFKCISHHGNGVHFTQGLNEELKHQLFKTFGKIIVSQSLFTFDDVENQTLKNISSPEVNHLLEGSIQIDEERIRASIRLVDASIGRITWSEQFDRNPFFVITHQEELASSICGALKGFLGYE